MLIPIAFIEASRDEATRKTHILKSKCPRCGEPLDLESIAHGDAKWHEFMQNLMTQGWKPRVERDLHAICGTCGAELDYRSENHELVVRQGSP